MSIPEIVQQLYETADHLKQTYDAYGGPMLDSMKGTTVLADSAALLMAQSKVLAQEAQIQYEQYKDELAQQVIPQVEAANMSPQELTAIEAQHKIDDERRAALDDNIKKLEAQFEQRHAETDSQRKEELRAQLQEKLEQLRTELEHKILEEARQRALEEQQRER